MNLIFKLRLLLVILTFNLLGNSQNSTNNIALILDLAGHSGLYSLNGEYIIGDINDSKLNARIGFGYYSGDQLEFLSIPIGVNVLTGKNKNHLEFGLGFSYIRGYENLYISTEIFGNPQVWWRSEGIYFVPSIGYRFDKLTNGLILKVYYSPLIPIYDFFDKDQFINELIPVIEGNWTKEEFYNYTNGNNNSYPTTKNRFVNFGVSIGYRF